MTTVPLAAPTLEHGAQRVSGVADTRAPFWVRVLFMLQRRRHGTTLEPTRVWARAPKPLRGFLHFVSAVDRRTSPIAPALRSLVMVKISQLNACSFCVDLNSAKLQDRGVSSDKVLRWSRTRPRSYSRKRRSRPWTTPLRWLAVIWEWMIRPSGGFEPFSATTRSSS